MKKELKKIFSVGCITILLLSPIAGFSQAKANISGSGVNIALSDGTKAYAAAISQKHLIDIAQLLKTNPNMYAYSTDSGMPYVSALGSLFVQLLGEPSKLHNFIEVTGVKSHTFGAKPNSYVLINFGPRFQDRTQNLSSEQLQKLYTMIMNDGNLSPAFDSELLFYTTDKAGNHSYKFAEFSDADKWAAIKSAGNWTLSIRDDAVGRKLA